MPNKLKMLLNLLTNMTFQNASASICPSETDCIFYPEYMDTLFLPSFFETYRALSA